MPARPVCQSAFCISASVWSTLSRSLSATGSFIRPSHIGTTTDQPSAAIISQPSQTVCPNTSTGATVGCSAMISVIALSYIRKPPTAVSATAATRNARLFTRTKPKGYFSVGSCGSNRAAMRKVTAGTRLSTSSMRAERIA